MNPNPNPEPNPKSNPNPKPNPNPNQADAWWPWLLGNAGRLVEPLLCKTAAQGAATQVRLAP